MKAATLLGGIKGELATLVAHATLDTSSAGRRKSRKARLTPGHHDLDGRGRRMNDTIQATPEPAKRRSPTRVRPALLDWACHRRSMVMRLCLWATRGYQSDSSSTTNRSLVVLDPRGDPDLFPEVRFRLTGGSLHISRSSEKSREH